MSAQALAILQDGRKALQEEMEQLERDAQLVQSDVGRSELARGERKIRAIIDELDHCIGQIEEIQGGKVPGNNIDDSLLRLKPGQYKGIKSLVAAVQAYLSHCDPPGKPIKVTFLTEQLNVGGFTVLMGRSKTPSKRRPVEPRDIRLMASNDIHEKEPRADKFYYGRTYRMNKKDDEIGLVINERKTEVMNTEMPPVDPASRRGMQESPDCPIVSSET